jgi:hypothetical protein
VAAADTEAFARCEECARPWDEPAEPWRADWIDDDDPEVLVPDLLAPRARRRLTPDASSSSEGLL